MAQVRHLCFKVGVLGLFDMGNDEPLPKSEEELKAEAEETPTEEEIDSLDENSCKIALKVCQGQTFHE